MHSTYFNNDRSRFKSDIYNWDEIPTDTGAPLSENYNVIENNQPDPIVEDVDGDGIKEIFFTSYDGKIHGFWLDKTEHHNWPLVFINLVMVTINLVLYL